MVDSAPWRVAGLLDKVLEEHGGNQLYFSRRIGHGRLLFNGRIRVPGEQAVRQLQKAVNARFEVEDPRHIEAMSGPVSRAGGFVRLTCQQ